MKPIPLFTPLGRSFRVLALSTSLALACAAQAQVPVFTNIWNVSSGTNTPNDLPSSGNNVRGLALNPVTTNVIYATTTQGTNGGNSHATVLSFANAGAVLGQVSGSGISSGTLGLDQARVSDDGSIYVCNLSGAPASDFKIYRWPADSDFTTAPTVVYDSGSGTSFQYRVGDYMDLRGGGLNTEIVVGGNGSGANVTTNFLIFRPTDATATSFTNFSITIPGSASSICGGGITFEGTNNALYIKAAGGKTCYRLAYNPTNLTAQVTSTFQMDQSANNGLKYFSVNGVKMLATVCTATTALTNSLVHQAKVLQLLDSSNALVVLNAPLPYPNQGNGNALGLVDYQKGYAVFSEPNNGISLFQLGFVTNTPAKIANQPAGSSVVETFNYIFTSSASGTAPIGYQWYFAGATATNLLAGKTNSSLGLTNLAVAQAGGYFVVVTNAYGADTSAVATLNVLPAHFSRVMAPLWTLAPGSRPYVSNDNNQRGLAFDPVTGNLVLVSRTPTNGVHLLNGATGADLGDMDLSQMTALSSPGTFPLNMAAVADDGVVYVANLLNSATSDYYVIYSWASANSSAAQGLAYFGNPGLGRLGDTLAAHGTGTGTELLASFRTGTNVALFNTPDGFNYNLNILAVTNLPADAVANGFAGLGLAFGPTNTFWAKSANFKLRLVQYDVPSLTAWVIADYDVADGTMYPIGVDNANNFLLGVGAGEEPQNLELWDLEAAGGPALLDRELFATDNANANGTGAVSFDIGGSRAFALDSNNGLLAVTYAPRLRAERLNNQLVLSWAGSAAALQRATPSVAGPYNSVIGAASPYTNAVSGPVFYRLTR